MAATTLWWVVIRHQKYDQQTVPLKFNIIFISRNETFGFLANFFFPSPAFLFVANTVALLLYNSRFDRTLRFATGSFFVFFRI